MLILRYTPQKALITTVISRQSQIEARSDNGSEFIAHVVQDWFREHGIKTIYIEPGSPWQNGWIESFHSLLRDEQRENAKLAPPVKAEPFEV